MKLAISGKGGVGKSTLCAALSLLLAKRGQKVLAVDADPDANLASCLGISEEKQKSIIPISKRAKLIEERTGAKVKQYGQIFKLNPEVSDIADSCAFNHEGVSLIVLGAVDEGGAGCACPENVLIRSLIADLVLYKNEALILDMEAGVEHLGRATAAAVDAMIVVLEPGQRSVESAFRVLRMAGDIGINTVKFVGNKVSGEEDKRFLYERFPQADFLGVIPLSEEIRRTDRSGLSVLEGVGAELTGTFETILAGLEGLHKGT